MIRNVERVIAAPPYHWVGNGFRVHSFFPSATNGIDGRRMSPWFLMDYESAYHFPPSLDPRGVEAHPHRGIETVSIIYEGKVAHHDSVGNGGVIGKNDVQWMTAGSGILHKEYIEEEFNKQGGVCQMVQLWVNLPQKYKMTKPKYQDLLFKDANKFISDNQKVHLNIIAGNYKNIEGRADLLTPVELFDLTIAKGSKIDFSFNSKHNLGMLVIDGIITINDRHSVQKDYFILFENIGSEVTLFGEIDSKVLILSGEPIEESIAPYGPFVMNNMNEIYEAFQDYKNGKFGFLE
ncbi:MAG TPA: pirin family protein [Candidatus Kapabacteria bacterium]|nr:pirin family protein [Candidatus Kapabacteria bacterium]